MRITGCVWMFYVCIKSVFAQVVLPQYPDSIFSTYYHQRWSHFNTLPQTKGDIIFLGNSITDGAEWSELFQDNHIKNRGISGDFTAGVLHRLNEVAERKPDKVFLLIGVNDLARKISTDSILKNLFLIADFIYQETPATQLFIQSILPVNDAFRSFTMHTNKGDSIRLINKALQQQAALHHYTYIELNKAFSDKEGKLNKAFTNDGLHLKGEGHILWKHLVYPYVYDLQPKPALIPLPQQLTYDSGYFSLIACKTIVIEQDSLRKEALFLQQSLLNKGLSATITTKADTSQPFIQIKISKVDAPMLPEEAYRLQVTEKKVTMEANTLHGIFNAVQTFNQLARDGVLIDACNITDYPAFAWRGYMVDVGRNYQSVDLLKQQIDAMAAYKLNVFHFHPTEDIAWRLAVKQYPQLTTPENMERNKGLFYTEDDMQTLIRYCKDRYITFVPEIDMPGHSAAFTRAMKTNMQSDSGLRIMKDILKSFCNTYNIDYLHIGGDEVKITNPQFLPDIIAYIEKLGKKTIGWMPGGNLATQTIRQLWQGNTPILKKNGLQYIDSRHLYLNHMDPLESVVTIFNRRIGNETAGNNTILGGEICVWPDRAVANEEAILKQNPVYPAMLAFAERAWRGGGNEGWVANIGKPGEPMTLAFTEFENLLLDHKQEYFKGKPFPYVKQTNTIWNFYGPYSNNGDLAKQFLPETTSFNFNNNMPAFKAVGGTVILRHWWAPMIKGLIDKPAENTTWYAETKLWSEQDIIHTFWIGFNNLSRSPATNSPESGTWNNLHSSIWVNGKIISPPAWKHAGMKGNAEMPLADEGYEYRQPTAIYLHKGWNTVLVKLPVGSFAADWQNPVKWMFTFVQVN
ncbi:beta-N-acetylhexosaminidase [Ilyomonas limi]|uniref:beta-N-acetylhexosaminidase n=1 Tax=Ilyomonas limi TaxID=2575867 RepID=A0A4U3L930_9BACT|nr:family 20 glycosylhydrolase [Ilyomonas limi]TKK71029.1 beta-N-acetylhexosaminidase [Ilyomonas limi]